MCPEAPFPALGGGAQRIASLIEYFVSRGAAVDVLTFVPFEPPAGLIREVHSVPLPPNSRSLLSRVLRNAGRLCRSVPPLVDRLSGFDSPIRQALSGRRYDLAILEHFWVAPYVTLIREYAGRVWCDLHNVESVFFASLAAASSGPARWVHQRFAALNRDLEQCLLPQFDGCLVCSESDAARISVARPVIVPNTIAWHPRVERQKDPALVFSGNLEYHPNIQGVRWFYECIWPGLRRVNADLKWRLVGMNPHAVERIVASDPRIECTGPVEDALDWIGRSRLAVVPLRSGSGTRVKILEAWAAGTAVVSTAIGAEGLPAEGALRIADRADDFVRVVNELLSNAEERLRLESAGRATYEEYFHYQAAWKRLDQAQIL